MTLKVLPHIFLYDFFIIKVIKIDLFVNISTYNLIFYCIKKSHQIKFDTIFLINLFFLNVLQANSLPNRNQPPMAPSC